MPHGLPGALLGITRQVGKLMTTMPNRHAFAALNGLLDHIFYGNVPLRLI